MKETWKDIVGFEGLYQISNMGRVKVLEKKLKTRNGFAIRREKIMKPVKKDNNYLFVRLTNKEGLKKCLYVHRLVAIHFIPNPENKPDVNHKRSNKSDNRFFRLEWCTKSENLIHSFKQGTHIPTRGTISTMAKLNETKVLQIKETYSQGGTSIRKLADQYGVHHSVIDGILKGKRWPHVTLKKAS